MDGSGDPKESRERSQPRASPRANTASIANAQSTPKSMKSTTPKSMKSTSSTPSRLREPTHATAHPTHKFHHSHCGESPASMRTSSRLSRQSSQEPRQSKPPVSNFLHEKLQRERQAESERLAKKLSGSLSSSAGDVRDREAQNSPSRSSAAGTGRGPRSNSGDEDSSQHGMGAKQMDKAFSNLHKQNFDLKLELYHRRERQSALEQRVEKLESEQRETNEMNDKLLAELQNRDKAVEEAVNMIVKLEARVDALVREKEMVRQVEFGGPYHHPQVDDAEAAMAETPRLNDFGLWPSVGETKNLERMPSFLSEQSEHTENLRNVVLQSRSSLMHLRKVSESSADPSESHRFASPSLSILSESSFKSVYGSKDGQDTTGLPTLDDLGGMNGMDGSQFDRSRTPTRKTSMGSWDSRSNLTPNHGMNAADKTRNSRSTQPRSSNDIFIAGSPLQQLDRRETKASATDVSPASSGSNQGRRVTTPTRARAVKPQTQARTKQDKRAALHKVLTNYPTNNDFNSSLTLPPTPDTVSSSFLRTHKHHTSSQDSLMKQVEIISADSSFGPQSDRSGHSVSSIGRYQASPHLDSQLASTTAFSSRRHVPAPVVNSDLFSGFGHLAQALPRRPHSAAETASSRARADSFVSDSDSDGGVDARSEGESVDYFMRESLKEDGRNVHSQRERGKRRSPSPDLFHFPADAGGWETDVIFGALKGSGFLGSPVSTLKRDPIDDMTSSFEARQTETLEPPITGPAPPCPSRRSSLQARTGSSNAEPLLGGKLRKSPVRGISVARIDTRGRSNSIDSAARNPPHKMPSQQSEAGAGGKRSQYPPISGLQSRGRSLGLNTLFRRSGSESYSVPTSATEPIIPPMATPHLPPPQQQAPSHPFVPPKGTRPTGRSSVPPPLTMPWAMRPPRTFEDDFSSATPPPIMRNRGPQPAASGDSKDPMSPGIPQTQVDMMTGPSTPTTVVFPAGGSTVTTVTGPPSATKKRWFGLGRRGSLKG
ncbi:Uu.00g062520.m01.CDS01 [Anthostomella pinea]|uniref:Uu.00g062520.m01.CDS01 n=1 Tax=Anthostomella pinea TaxID=933095 RepID=A0AAI8VT68_9PEZI|nr:Uu.00g062520.m01.CDS01 [Anthostomella pinea]